MATLNKCRQSRTLAPGDELYWGNDATAMIEDRLAEPTLFNGAEYPRIATLPVGVERARFVTTSRHRS
jgi:hypothetical protein